jgi:ATP-binding cassette subfamily B protein
LRVFKGYFKAYRKWIIGVVISITLVDIVGLVPPWIIGTAVDYLSGPLTSLETAGLFALALVLVEFGRATIRFLWRRIAWDFSRAVERDLRERYFAHLLKLSPSYFDNHKTGELMTLATSDIEFVRMFFGMGILILFDALAILITTLPVLFYLNLRLTIYTLLPMPFLAVVTYVIIRLIHKCSHALQKQYATLTAKVQENLTGAKVVRSYVREQHEVDVFSGMCDENVRLSMQLARVNSFFHPVIFFVVEFGALLVLWIGGSDVIRGTISLGDFVKFSFYLAWLAWPMVGLGYTLTLYQRGVASMERIRAVLMTEPEIKDPIEAYHGSQFLPGGESTTVPDTPGAVEEAPPLRLRGEIHFKNLNFSFGKVDTLRDINLSVPQGTTLGIVGAVGSGKSALVSLLPRLYDPPPETVFIDGMDVRRIPLAILRGSIGFATQDTLLFSDTVGNNLAFGLPGAAHEKVAAAAEQVHIADEVATFPEGFQQIVGERGVTLSGGQKQRVTIGRALILDPPILILDDVLSSVDTATESKLLSSLKQAATGRTCLIVSHRLSTVQHADQIIVLDQGRIVERGTHAELLAKGGLYAGMHEKQLLAEELVSGF